MPSTDGHHMPSAGAESPPATQCILDAWMPQRMPESLWWYSLCSGLHPKISSRSALTADHMGSLRASLTGSSRSAPDLP